MNRITESELLQGYQNCKPITYQRLADRPKPDDWDACHRWESDGGQAIDARGVQGKLAKP